MENKESNRVDMIRNTTKFCDDNTAATAGITAFAPVLATAKTKLSLIDSLNEIAIATTKGVTLDAKKIRTDMTVLALKCANAVFAYAASINDNTLKAKVNYTEAKLNKFKKDEVDDVCQTIHDVTDANIANVQNYGITAADVTDLQTSTDLYRIAINSPRQAIISKKDANRQIKTLIREIIDNIFEPQMDKMVGTLKASNPSFVKKYFDARQIINLGSTKGKLRGTTKDKDEVPIQNVTITVKKTGTTEVVAQTKSEKNGTISAIVPPGNHDIFVEHPDHNTITETDVRFGPGKELKRKYVLTPKV